MHELPSLPYTKERILQNMGKLPQIYMRHPDITNLPELVLPEGVTLHTHIEGTEENWENLIESAFGHRYSFDACIRNGGDYKPEHVLYLSKDGKDIATTTAVEKDIFPGEGWFRMVGVSADAKGTGAGRLIALAALHTLAKRGYKTVVLSTDDERLPAINLYYSLGFRPIYTHESHTERWNKILPQLKYNK